MDKLIIEEEALESGQITKLECILAPKIISKLNELVVEYNEIKKRLERQNNRNIFLMKRLDNAVVVASEAKERIENHIKQCNDN